MNDIPITRKYNLPSFLSFFVFDDNLIQEPSIACVEMTNIYHVKECIFLRLNLREKGQIIFFQQKHKPQLNR